MNIRFDLMPTHIMIPYLFWKMVLIKPPRYRYILSTTIKWYFGDKLNGTVNQTDSYCSIETCHSRIYCLLVEYIFHVSIWMSHYKVAYDGQLNDDTTVSVRWFEHLFIHFGLLISCNSCDPEIWKGFHVDDGKANKTLIFEFSAKVTAFLLNFRSVWIIKDYSFTAIELEHFIGISNFNPIFMAPRKNQIQISCT